ncbi:MAG: hypothetical protein JWM25_1720 [Thermoleophilia bacterium]|nr:hypothetical protein [Thermoleophilia bacterium]MCZ4497135.1 hypothetical protein [Thermoleophilia bacterium]
MRKARRSDAAREAQRWMPKSNCLGAVERISARAESPARSLLKNLAFPRLARVLACGQHRCCPAAAAARQGRRPRAGRLRTEITCITYQTLQRRERTATGSPSVRISTGLSAMIDPPHYSFERRRSVSVSCPRQLARRADLAPVAAAIPPPGATTSPSAPSMWRLEISSRRDRHQISQCTIHVASGDSVTVGGRPRPSILSARYGCGAHRIDEPSTPSILSARYGCGAHGIDGQAL